MNEDFVVCPGPGGLTIVIGDGQDEQCILEAQRIVWRVNLQVPPGHPERILGAMGLLICEVDSVSKLKAECCGNLYTLKVIFSNEHGDKAERVFKGVRLLCEDGEISIDDLASETILSWAAEDETPTHRQQTVAPSFMNLAAGYP